VALLGPAGALAGGLIARHAHLPRYAIVGVTASEIVLFSAESFHVGWKPSAVVSRFPRSTTTTSQRQGVLVRKLTLERAGESVALESPRLGRWHAAGVFSALRANAAAAIAPGAA
jgi:hypothetical protein